MNLHPSSVVQNKMKLCLPPPQALRFSHKAGEGGELEARETGDELARDHGKEKEER